MEIFVFLVILGMGGIGLLYLYKRLLRSGALDSARVQERLLRHLAANMPLPSSAKFPMKAGEGFVYEIKNASLVEPRRGTRTSSRSTHAVTFALAKGLYYTVGSSKGSSPEPDDELRTIDQGTATFTSRRVIFVGPKQSRQWDFSKIMGWDEGEGSLLTLAVSNRQKVSGIKSSGDDLLPSVALQIAIAVGQDGWAAAKEMCREGAESARKQKEFILSNPSAGLPEILRYAGTHPSFLLEQLQDLTYPIALLDKLRFFLHKQFLDLKLKHSLKAKLRNNIMKVGYCELVEQNLKFSIHYSQKVSVEKLVTFSEDYL